MALPLFIDDMASSDGLKDPLFNLKFHSSRTLRLYTSDIEQP